MERAGKLIGKLKTDRLEPEQLARSAWTPAVGKRIAANTRAIGLVRGRLVVETSDAVWSRQLFALRAQILSNIAKIVGPDLVSQLEFRVAIAPKIQPQREQAAARPADEADGIVDPVLRRLYVASRKKELA